MNNRSAGYVVSQEAGASGTADRRRVVKLTAEQTSGSVGIITTTVRPGVLVPPHHHEREDEVWHILSGEVVCLLGDEIFPARAGDFIWRPKGHVHASWVGPGGDPAQVTSCIIPGGWEQELLVMDQKTADGQFDEQAFVEIARTYGIHFDFERGRELASEFGLALMGQRA